MIYLGALICGVLVSLSMMADGFHFLAFFAFSPVIFMLIRELYSEKTKTRKFVFILFAFGAGMFFTLFYWFISLYPLDFLSFTPGESIFVIAFAWIGTALLQMLEMTFIMFFFRFFKQRERFIFLLPIVFASLWCIFEWTQSLFWIGLPWGRLAISQVSVLPFIQSASLFGSLFVSFIIVLINGYIALAFYDKRIRKKSSLAAIIIFAANMAFGYLALSVYYDGINSTNVGIVQGNIDSREKWGDGSTQNILDKYVEHTDKLCLENDLDIVVWPETVIPVVLRNYQSYYRIAADTAQRNGIMLVIGTYDAMLTDGELYNSVIIFEKDGSENPSVYKKRHLVPFGEYLPMRKVFEAVLPMFGGLNAFDSEITPGGESEIAQTEYGSIGALVCFDSIYDFLVRSSVKDGAELLLLLTNDSWYGSSAAVYQHNSHAVLRAVENGRFIVRAANTGISSFIKPTGEVIKSLPPLEEGAISAKVYFRGETTLYNRLGNLIVPICAAFLLTSLFIRIKKEY